MNKRTVDAIKNVTMIFMQQHIMQSLKRKINLNIDMEKNACNVK